MAANEARRLYGIHALALADIGVLHAVNPWPPLAACHPCGRASLKLEVLSLAIDLSVAQSITGRGRA